MPTRNPTAVVLFLFALLLSACERTEPNESGLLKPYDGGVVQVQAPPPGVTVPDLAAPEADEPPLADGDSMDDDSAAALPGWGEIPTPLPIGGAAAEALDEAAAVTAPDDGTLPLDSTAAALDGDGLVAVDSLTDDADGLTTTTPSGSPGGTPAPGMTATGAADPAVPSAVSPPMTGAGFAPDPTAAESVAPQTARRPLLDWPLHQLSLERVEDTGFGPRAVFRTPNGAEVTVRQGDLVGDVAARITDVQADRVLLAWLEIDERGTPRIVYSKVLLGS